MNDDASGLRWRAVAIEEAQDLGLRGLLRNSSTLKRAVFANLAVFDLQNWPAAFAEWTTAPTSDELAAMTPRQVAAALSGLAPYLIELLVTANPELMGALDGVPPEVRYQANRILIEREIERLEEQIEEVSTNQANPGFRWTDLSNVIGWFTVSSLTERLSEHLEETVDEYRRWLDEGRQILLFDPVGDGRVVEVFGDLSVASRVGVVVPGMSNDITNFSDGAGGFRTTAMRLHEASSVRGSANIATIAWLGYDTPDGVDAAAAGAARAGAPSLARLLEGIDPDEEKQLTVVAHSYGSVLAGIAARQGLEANDIVFVGSPGTTLDRADEAALRPGGRVWAALARNDPIRAGISAAELPPWWVPPVLAPSWLLMDLGNGGAEELWHGTNPVSDEFGARRLTTDGSSGHSSYFDGDSLLNLARIVQGLYSEVELVE
jgi:pimeloyl-ACP methyl ester carboxylesterase